MRRVVVVGAGGFFGAAVVAELRRRGGEALACARRDVDADDSASLHATLRRDDVVVDAAGPFHRRTPALVEAAMAIGCDVVDLCDDLGYAQRLWAREAEVAAAGITVCPCCSSVSMVTWLLVGASGVTDPVRASVCLRPAARETASRGTARVLLHEAGGDVRSLADGTLVRERGWSRGRVFAAPQGAMRGRLAESADALNLPRVWPGLRTVDFWVDSGVPGLNAAVGLVAGFGAARSLAVRSAGAGAWVARRLGRRDGAFAVEVEDRKGSSRVAVARAPRRSYMIAVLPAVLAAISLAGEPRRGHGLLAPDRQVERGALLDALRAAGVQVEVTELRAPVRSGAPGVR